MTGTIRRIAGPFSRVEGDLEITLDITDGHVAQARVTATLYRGFESLLTGRAPMDGLVLVPRICGICSAAQSAAAARALAHLTGVQAPPNGRLAAEIVLACETLADHLTHFALFFMPDFAHPTYRGRAWFETVAARFGDSSGGSSARLLAARTRLLDLMGLFAGKWPHTLALQPGGTTKAIDAAERMRALSLLAECREVMEAVLYGGPIGAIGEIASRSTLDSWTGGDFGLFLTLARDLNLDALGRGPAAFLSQDAGTCVIDGQSVPFDPAGVREDLASSWYHGETEPDADKAGAYSWCKAPRLNGRAMEVGALARAITSGDPLALDLVAGRGGTVRDRVVARLIEAARLLDRIGAAIRALTPGEPFCIEPHLPADGEAHGLVEAARGTLGHWIRVENGVIRRWQVIAPTTWNFSPRDATGQPGPLEQALAGTPAIGDDGTPIAVQHVVRSFDPCMACTVH